MQHILTYDFDELDVGDGLIVSGTADIKYKFCQAEPDVNVPEEFKWYIDSIIIRTRHGNTIPLKRQEDLYIDVENALLATHDDAILQHLIDAMELRYATHATDYEHNNALRNDA